MENRRFPILFTLPLLIASLGLAWLLWLTFVQVFVVQWNAPRLAPAAALVRGLAIYGTADSGPFLGWVYGPVFPMVFAAIAWLPDQVSVHVAAWLLNLCLAAGPVWLVARFGVGRDAAAGAVLVGGLLVLSTELGRTALSFIHVDVLCCGFGTVACLAMARGLGAGGAAWIIAAALASLLAVGTKQVAVALIVGLSLWLWSTGHRRKLGQYLGCLVLGGLLAGAAAGWFFGWDKLAFNLWTVHRHNPLAPDFGRLLLTGVGELAFELLPVVIAWFVTRPVAGVRPPSHSLERALEWVAFAHLPFGLLAAAKVAGGLNSVHTFNYLGCLLVIRLARAFATPSALGRTGWRLLVMATVLAWVQAWQGTRGGDLPMWQALQRLSEEEELARREPGRVYFPWNPLVTVLSERQVRPFDDALLCLERVGFPADRTEVLKAIPPGALVVYPDPVQSTFVLKYFEGPRPR